jgi:hypothetical protein
MRDFNPGTRPAAADFAKESKEAKKVDGQKLEMMEYHAVKGLMTEEQRIRAELNAHQATCIEVFNAIEDRMHLEKGAIGNTHYIDGDRVKVRPAKPKPAPDLNSQTTISETVQ